LNFLWGLPEAWNWLKEVFVEPEEFHIALCAYYMALNILELADTIASGNENIVAGDPPIRPCAGKFLRVGSTGRKKGVPSFDS
jgi:hypothetical protein